MVQLVGTTSLGLGKLIDGKNQFVHIRYSAHSNGSNMTTEIQADTKYIGIATNSSETAPTSPSDYSWGRFVGTPGTSSYTWIRYSSNADGSNMTTIPNEETKYIGVAVTAEDSAPTDYTRYSWALFKGSDGRGVKKTEVSYQKSTSGTVIPAGAWLASIPSLSDGEYLWTRTLFTYTDGTTTSTYNVSRNGTSGLGIARTDVHYQKSTSGTVAPTGTWTVTIPTVRANEYLWTRTTITYTDDSTSVSYSVGKMGADGKDAQLLYLTASSQIQAFDKDNQPKTTQPITISAKLQNASGTATFTAIPYIGNTAQTPITLGGTGNDRTLLPSQWTDPKWTIIAITATLGSLTDTISVNKVKDGESGETPVVHIAWADSADGSEGFTLELPTNKIPKYRGYYVDYSTVASTDPKKYKWERNPDDTGAEVDKAMTAVESAIANAEEAERLAATASQTATIAKQEASAAQNAASMAQGEVSRIEGVIVGVQGDIDTALQEVADQAADLQATKETLELNYAKKTEVSDVQAALTTEISKKVGELQTTVSQTYAAKNDVVSMEGRLQSQITQTAGEVSSVVGKVDKLEADTTEAQKKVGEALEKSAAAQATASQAQAYADAADRKVTAAQTDLNEAKQNLVNTINRVDATEADIAEAQLKVESAQAAVAQAQKDAAEAALAASNAQAAADKAQQDVAALTKRVTSAETAITQNTEQIRLSATKTEEIGTKLDGMSIGGENLINLSEIKPYSDATIDTSNYIKRGEVILTTSTSTLSGLYFDFYNDAKPETSYVFSYDITALGSQPFNTIRGHMDTGFYTMKYYVDGVDAKIGYPSTYTFSDSSVRKHHIEVYVKLKNDMTNDRRIFIQPNHATQASEKYKIENLKIVEGNKYTNGWNAAPSDIKTEIDNTNSNIANNYYSKTQTDAAINVASDSITTSVRKEVTTEITNVNNKVDNLKLVGENLILNGYGEFGDNKNFTNYIFDGANSYNNRPSFKTNLKTTLSIGNNRIPIDIDKAYQFSMNIKSDNGGKIYLGWDEYDIDGYYIGPTYVMGYPNTTTTLARDLNNGDTVVYLESTANWLSSDYTHQNGLIFWNYRDSTGYLYPEGVYSRNAWIDLYTKDAVNKTNNTITLKSPWKNGRITAGTKVSQSNSQGHKYFNFANTSVPSSWTNTSFIIGKDHKLQPPYVFDGNKFSPAAKSIAFMAMWSYGSSPVDTYYINSVELKNIDDKLLIDGINNNLTNNYYSKTQTDAAIKVATDSITSTVRTEITTVNNKVDNLQFGGQNLVLKSDVYIDNEYGKDFYNFGFSKDLLGLRNQKVTISIDVELENARFSRIGFEPSVIYEDKREDYLGVWLRDTQEPLTIKKRLSATVKIADKKIISLGQTGMFLQGYISGKIKIGRPALIVGDGTEWSPAKEDMATAEQAQQAQNDANEANSKADSNEHRVSLAESTIKQLSDSISMMVTDSNGSSMMTQTSDGWTFNIGSITSAIDSAANNIDNLSGSLSQTNNVVNNLNNLANDLSKKTAYINMTTDETGAPCIELGKTGNAFKVRITNTSVDFIEGSSKIAYVSNQALFIEKAIIKSELRIGETKGFIWKTRSNGNMGLRWFG